LALEKFPVNPHRLDAAWTVNPFRLLIFALPRCALCFIGPGDMDAQTGFHPQLRGEPEPAAELFGHQKGLGQSKAAMAQTNDPGSVVTHSTKPQWSLCSKWQ
jgi:hypothetical protein